ncbi:Glycosyltransferase involved in cell wall bisynthesis [Chryseobacterium arachidis]|uniref:Glycosyltransferase involved in cell wall bisynthesis n=1 Tax=Chryseobacterium arachidis TaxID=1416778 RepID=A0A1M4XFD8_9FLAO|nr:glycosyltransferase family A protein [Chryseobacterium arachidis]SHE92053.1 Glycosyltransferase involved in cell wall bisynthesis [Chryseobacterium arachidis]
MHPKISIVVPAYNQAEYLDECLQSVMYQTYTDWECIIIDDGSTDHTKEVAQTWTQKDSRFKYLAKINGGVSSARNLGIENASATWILPLDGDDKIASEYLELASGEFHKNPDVIYCKAAFFGNVNDDFILDDFSYEQLLLNNLIFCSGFFKKEAWQKTEGYDEKLIHGFEDWDFWIELLKNSEKKVTRLDYLGFYYRRKDSSRDVNINKNLQQKEEAFNYIFNKHQKEYYRIYGNFFDLVKQNKKLKEDNRKLTAAVNESILKKIIRKIRK